MRKYQSQCFQIGRLAEARTFVEGYRGAWFRCKIKKVNRKKGQITAYVVEYYDYPEEPEETVKLFDVLPSESSGGQNAKRELMLRPHFPTFYHESNLPDVHTITEVVVAVADVWKIGDLVDWFSDGCFWSGTITEIIDDEQVKVKLLEPPRGEGSSYMVNYKDLRPSLDWSPASGWTVPAPLDCQSGHMHTRLIRPLTQGPLLRSLVDEKDEDQESIVVTPRSSLEFNQSSSSHTSVSSLPQLQQSEDISKKGMQDIGGSATTGKPSCSDSVSGTYVRDVQAEVPVATCAEHQDHENGSAKKMRLNETITLNVTACDSIESAILDLEELVNRVKWLKQILKFGISSNPQGPTWEFHEHPGVSTPK